jgi:GT2 family glycosyltransferase
MSAGSRAPDGDVEILIPHWNRAALLREALDSLRRQTLNLPICVIDNGSTDGSAAMLEAEFPDVRHVALGANRGFGAALNAGAESSRAQLLVFLNNDAVADRRFGEEIVATHRRTGAEMVAGFLLRPEGVIDTAGVQVDRSLIAYDYLHGLPYPPPASEAAAPPLAPSGGAGAFERDAFLRVGGFDEDFFAYLEDVDLGIRMRLAGMHCAVAAGAFAWHRHAGTLGPGSTFKNRLMGRGRGRLLWKHGASLDPRSRLRGAAIDGIVYCGQAIVDRNLGGALGRIDTRRSARAGKRPAVPDFAARVPMLDVGTVKALSRRLARGRRYRLHRERR